MKKSKFVLKKKQVKPTEKNGLTNKAVISVTNSYISK